MAVSSATFQCTLATSLVSDAGARLSLSQIWSSDLKDGAGDYLFDRVFFLEDYSLTVAAGNLDLDLYDLGSLNIGTGAGDDNLGLSHANARIIAIAIRNQTITSGGALRIDQAGAGSTAWGGPFTDRDMSQGEYQKAYLGLTGITVTDTTDHILRLSAQTNDCTIDVAFWSAQT